MIFISAIKSSIRSKKIAAKIRAEVEEERKDTGGNGKNAGSYWGGNNAYSVSHLNDLKKSQNTMPKYVTKNN